MPQPLVQFTLSFDNDLQFSRAMKGMIDALTDLRPVWKQMIRVIFKAEEKQFDTVGRHGSGGWAKLSDDYAEWKALRYPGQPILQARGDMMRSMTNARDPGAVIHTARLFMGIGSSVTDERGRPYWYFHQRGTRTMPRRRPYDLTKREKHQVSAILARELRRRWMLRKMTTEYAPGLVAQTGMGL